ILLWLMTDGKLSGKPFTQRPDSLRTMLAKATSSESIAILNALADWYAPVDFDSSIMYSAQAMRLGTVHGDQVEVGIARLNTGNAYYYQLDFNNALISYLAAAKILEECEAWDQLVEVNLMLGHINFFIQRPEKAVSYYQRAKRYIKTEGKEDRLKQIYQAISLTYSRDGNTDSALYYSQKMLDYSKAINDTVSECLALIILGQTYTDERAVNYCNKALEIAIQIDDKNLISIIYNNLASFYDRSSPKFDKYGDLKLSRHYYEKATEAAINHNYSIVRLFIPVSLAEIDIEEGKFQQADLNLKRSEEELRVFPQYSLRNSSPPGYFSFGKIYDYFLVLRTRRDLYSARFKLAKATGDIDEAVEYLHAIYRAEDSLNAALQGRQLELIMAEAEAEKTEQKIRMLSQENELKQLRLNQSLLAFAGGGGLIIFSSLFILMFIHRKRSKAEQKSVLMEQRLLRAQMNPHFLFNSLASIQNYILNERPDEASTYLSRFSQLVRDVLDNSVEEFVLLRNEINAITNYLELQKARYEDQFVYSLEVDNTLDEDGLLVPPMLAQPFIKNAIEHGIKYKETTGHINIRFMAGGDLIWFEVEDDGVGREKALEIESKHKTKHRS
ncbi:MAG: histidine kinase, partial [Bacteroidales bacterium]|nr:histidine kinase [Bacteroidales bacterium]